MKKEQEDTKDLAQQSSPAVSRVDADLRSSSPTTPSLPGPLLYVTSKSETPSVPCTMLPSCVHQSIAESCKCLCVIFILGVCILLCALYQDYWKSHLSQQLFKVFILYFFAVTCFSLRWPSWEVTDPFIFCERGNFPKYCIFRLKMASEG
jgi:hypothetical protein